MTREELEHEYAALKAENAALRAQLQVLVAGVQELEGQLAKDSHNSSTPPSREGLARTPKSLRHKSGKKPGGQPGHRGSHRRLVAQPDAVVAHRPTTGGPCQSPLPATAGAWIERRQVHAVPLLRLVVPEHQVAQVRCVACGATTRGAVPAAGPAPVQDGPRRRALAVYRVQQQFVPDARAREVLAAVWGAPLSVGTLIRLVPQAGEHLHAVEGQIKRRLRRAPVRPHDETGLRVVGATGAGWQWTPVTRPPQLTHDALPPQRGAQALDALGIRPRFRDVSLHDGWTAYRHSRRWRPALCTAHHLRELTFVEEELHQAWAGQLKHLLRELRRAVAPARAAGATQLPATQRAAFRTRYEALLADGLAANPQPPPPAATPAAATDPAPRRRGRRKQSPARNLLDRLWTSEHEALWFLDDFAVPFDNNQAERDLRRIKVQPTIAATFRSPVGAHAVCRRRSVLSTWRTQGRSALAALDTVFAGQLLTLQVGT